MITKKELFTLIDESKDEFLSLGDKLFHCPELGFKEFPAKKLLVEKFKEYGIDVEAEYFETGFQVSIGSGFPKIGLIAELDAIIVPEHPEANNPDKCAHACGHSMQCTIMTDALINLFKSKITESLPGTITLFFTPGEEFVDLDYRRKLIKEGKINYLSGKQNMLAVHIFDDYDVIIHCHAMGEGKDKFNINSTLAGFIYKKFNFIGVESHAGALPHLGKNALNMFALFQSAMGMLRETYEEDDKVRFHGIVTNGGQTVNSIPSLVTYEAYLRCANWEKITKINHEIEEAAKHTAAALGGTCEIINTNGYLPFIQDRNLSEVAHQNMLLLTEDKYIGRDEVSIASGDIGDIACFKPTIQFGYSGISGRIHGSNFRIADTTLGYINPAKVVIGTVYDLLTSPKLVENIKANYKPSLTFDEYIEYLKQAK